MFWLRCVLTIFVNNVKGLLCRKWPWTIVYNCTIPWETRVNYIIFINHNDNNNSNNNEEEDGVEVAITMAMTRVWLDDDNGNNKSHHYCYHYYFNHPNHITADKQIKIFFRVPRYMHHTHIYINGFDGSMHIHIAEVSVIPYQMLLLSLNHLEGAILV